MELTQEDIRNIIALIGVAQIKGQEATTVALLQQKLLKLLEPKIENIQASPKGDKTGK